MSTTTPRFGFVKPDLDDAADITAMNENWDKIEGMDGHSVAHVTLVSHDDATMTSTYLLDLVSNPSIDLSTGSLVTLIPNQTSEYASVKIQINMVGTTVFYSVWQSTSQNTISNLSASSPSWFFANKPVLTQVFVDDNNTKNSCFKVVTGRPVASDISGTVAVSHGGTSATTAAKARENLGITYENMGEVPTDCLPVIPTDHLPIIPITNGGTGATTAAQARSNLGITNPFSVAPKETTRNEMIASLSSGSKYYHIQAVIGNISQIAHFIVDFGIVYCNTTATNFTVATATVLHAGAQLVYACNLEISPGGLMYMYVMDIQSGEVIDCTDDTTFYTAIIA